MATEKVTSRLVSDVRMDTDASKIKINNPAENSIQVFGAPTMEFPIGESVEIKKNLFTQTPDSFKTSDEKPELKQTNLFSTNMFQKAPVSVKPEAEKLAPLEKDKFELENPFKKEPDNVKSVLSHRLLKWFRRPNALSKLSSEEDIKTAVASNPRIGQILYEAGVPLVINYENLSTIKEGHLNDTVEYSKALAKKLGLSPEEVKTVEVAAAFHDIGKSLIPAKYLNKNGALSKDERKVVNLHAVLGYEHAARGVYCHPYIVLLVQPCGIYTVASALGCGIVQLHAHLVACRRVALEHVCLTQFQSAVVCRQSIPSAEVAAVFVVSVVV